MTARLNKCFRFADSLEELKGRFKSRKFEQTNNLRRLIPTIQLFVPTFEEREEPICLGWIFNQTTLKRLFLRGIDLLIYRRPTPTYQPTMSTAKLLVIFCRTTKSFQFEMRRLIGLINSMPDSNFNRQVLICFDQNS